MMGIRHCDTFLLCADTLDAHQNPCIFYLVSPVDVILQRHQTLQRLPFIVTERLSAEGTVAVLLDHEVAAPVSLWEHAHEERSCWTGKIAGAAVGDVRCPEAHQVAKPQIVIVVGVPESDLMMGFS